MSDYSGKINKEILFDYNLFMNCLKAENTLIDGQCVFFLYLFIWGFTSLYRSYHDG